MATFRVKYGDSYDFEGQDFAEVVPAMYSNQWRNDFPNPNEDGYMRSKAIEMCEWNKGTYYYDSRVSFAASMVRNDLLERAD